MGIYKCTGASPHFGSATCMVDVAVSEKQMSDVTGVMTTFPHSRKYFFRLTRPTCINQEKAIIRF